MQEDNLTDISLEDLKSMRDKGSKIFSKIKIYMYIMGILGTAIFLMLQNYLWAFIFFILFCPQWQDIYRIFHKVENERTQT